MSPLNYLRFSKRLLECSTYSEYLAVFIGSIVLKLRLYFSLRRNMRILPYFSFLLTSSLRSLYYLSKFLSFRVSESIYCLLDLSFIFLAVYSCLNFYVSLSNYYFGTDASFFYLGFESIGFCMVLPSKAATVSLKLFTLFSSCSSFFLASCSFFLR